MMSVHHPPKTLLFDVFGTAVDWRTTITKTLTTQCKEALNSNSGSISSQTQEKASSLTTADWQTFAQEWRNSYITFTRTYSVSSADSSSHQQFISVDEHHYRSLKSLLASRQLEDLWTESEIRNLSLAWHYLEPWTDSSPGLEELNKAFITAMLSNGNITLLEDLARYASLPFTRIFSAEHFNAYKPSSLVYHGAAGMLNLSTRECALVAAHLGDLKAAKECGYQTIYVCRSREESYSAEEVSRARAEGWVDMWIEEEHDGFLEVARRFGIESSDG